MGGIGWSASTSPRSESRSTRRAFPAPSTITLAGFTSRCTSPPRAGVRAPARGDVRERVVVQVHAHQLGGVGVGVTSASASSSFADSGRRAFSWRDDGVGAALGHAPLQPGWPRGPGASTPCRASFGEDRVELVPRAAGVPGRVVAWLGENSDGCVRREPRADGSRRGIRDSDVVEHRLERPRTRRARTRDGGERVVQPIVEVQNLVAASSSGTSRLKRRRRRRRRRRPTWRPPLRPPSNPILQPVVGPSGDQGARGASRVEAEEKRDEPRGARGRAERSRRTPRRASAVVLAHAAGTAARGRSPTRSARGRARAANRRGLRPRCDHGGVRRSWPRRTPERAADVSVCVRCTSSRRKQPHHIEGSSAGLTANQPRTEL